MPGRRLVTIGDLRASPIYRTSLRRSRAVRGVEIGHVDQQRYAERYMGAATSITAGSALQDAALALLNKFDASGVTPMSTADPVVGNFQTAWNADPANVSEQLSLNSDYDPLTQGALTAIVGGVAPPVNYGGQLVIPPPGTTPAAPSELDKALPWLLVAAAAAGAYFLFFRKRKTVHHHRAPGTAVEIKTNPRRPRRRNAGRRAGLLAF
jgi:hypothetical protein